MVIREKKMHKKTLKSKHGYDIPCVTNISGKEKKVIIISHGFGSSKASPTAQMIMNVIGPDETGTLAYDFPAHGESPADGKYLTLEGCLDDLCSVEHFVHKASPEADIMYFSSSFGAYINLLYLSKRTPLGNRSFLRSAAVNMPELFLHPTTEEKEQLSSPGYLMLDRGYEHPLMITKEFVDGLMKNDIFHSFTPSPGVSIAMVHGDMDECIPCSKAKEFAEKYGIGLTVIKGGDHRLMTPGSPEKVLRLAVEFFG